MPGGGEALHSLKKLENKGEINFKLGLINFILINVLAFFFNINLIYDVIQFDSIKLIFRIFFFLSILITPKD